MKTLANDLQQDFIQIIVPDRGTHHLMSVHLTWSHAKAVAAINNGANVEAWAVVINRASIKFANGMHRVKSLKQVWVKKKKKRERKA